MDTQSQVSNSDFSIIEDVVSPDDIGDAVSLEQSLVVVGGGKKSFKEVEFDGFCKLSTGDFSVRYKVNPGFQARSSDRIALYKVGFVSPHDYLLFRWATVPETSQNPIPLTIIFEGKKMPPSSIDHYQFCYLNRELKIMGVSHPFVIPTEEEVEDRVIGKSKLEADYQELKKTHEALVKRFDCLVAEATSHDKFVQDQCTNLYLAKMSCKEYEEKVKDLHQQLKQSNSQKLLAESLVDETKKELHISRGDVKDLEEKVIALEKQLIELKEAFTMLKDMNDVNEERQNTLEQENTQLKEVVVKFRERTGKLEESLTDTEKKKEAAETVAADLSLQLQTQSAEKTSLMEKNTLLTKRLTQERNNFKKFQRNMLMSTSSLDQTSEMSFGDFESDAGEAAGENEALSKSGTNKNLMESSACSNCSAGVNTLTEVVENKMESIVESLTSQMSVLRQELAKVQANSGQSSVDAASQHSGSKPSEVKQQTYFNSFLPVENTAPVFLPESTRQASSSQPKEIIQPIVIAAPPRAPSPPRQLPEPLQPETTITACQAAVMRLMSQNETSKNADHEEDEYQSADEASDVNSTGLFCPVCDAKFQTNSLAILEDHVNTHLENVCPICSKIFDSRDKKTFEVHVQRHLDEEDEKEANGGWIGSSRFSLLEID